MERLTLFQEYRLIERNESEINGTWKGMHLLLFFLAFVFGSFCTFCFHMLMYLFDEKCVLFPKLLSLTSLRHNVIYEFIPEDKAKFDMLPVDFLSTQWMEKSACYLPTYVPLVSGIFGLVWTTMFLMCSTGGRTLTGLIRSWRVVPPVFVFSLAMGGLCIYSSVMTHYGLQELCVKLSEITGSATCSYTVNVATLAYERHIRGVYQATRLTILSAWLHTSCWVLSALLAVLRVLLAVDFQLVRVSVDLVGNIDTMLERHERHIRTVSPNGEMKNLFHSPSYDDSTKYHFDYNKEFAEDIASLHRNESDLLFFADPPIETSELSLVPEELQKLSRLKAYESVSKEQQFIVKMVYDLVDNIELPKSPVVSLQGSTLSDSFDQYSETKTVARQFGQSDIATKMSEKHESINVAEAQDVAKEIKRLLHERLNNQLVELPLRTVGISHDISTPSTSKRRGLIAYEESTLNLTNDMRKTLQDILNKSLNDLEQQRKKSNLKNVSSQTDQKKKNEPKSRKVKISDSIDTYNNTDESGSDPPHNKETQTKPKEKQD